MWPSSYNPPLHVHSLLVQVIIKQEPGEVSTQQQQMVSTVTSQQQPAATAAHQFVAVKGGHMISMSTQKQAGGASGATTSKVRRSYTYLHTRTQKHVSHLRVNSDNYVQYMCCQRLQSFKNYIWHFVSFIDVRHSC